MIVYFDIDSTVFTTDLFKKTRIDPALSELLAVPVEVITKIEKQYFTGLTKGTDFKYQEYVAFLAEKVTSSNQVTVAQLITLFENPALYTDMLYPDVVPIFSELKLRGIPMGVYSEGFEDKLVFTDILEYFEPEHIHISRRKKTPEVLSKLEFEAIIVDDKLEYLTGLPEVITPLMINRQTEETVTEGVKIIHSLEEIVAYLS